MTLYHAKANKTISFDLTKNEQLIGRLIYKGWFKFNATMELNDGSFYDVEPKGFWGTTIQLKKIEEVLAKMKMNWNGEIVIETSFDGHLKDYVFKQVGLLKGTLSLYTREGEELLVINPVMHWGSITYEYRITTSDNFDQTRNSEIMLMLSLHCANYMMSLGATAASG